MRSQAGVKSIKGWKPVVKFFVCPKCGRRTGITNPTKVSVVCSWCLHESVET